MKKFFTLTALALLTWVGVQAQNYRRWDFTQWSDETVANLKAEASKGFSEGLWSDAEKADNSATTKDISPNNCYWQVGSSGTDGITLTANGTAIAETEGLIFVNTNARGLAIALNYGDCTSANGAGFGPYHGGAYLWLGSSKKNYFVIPNVKPGQPIRMGVESHKLTDARGVNLYVYKADKSQGVQLTAPDGSTVAAPKEYTEQEWVAPVGAEGANADGTYNILVYNTNGCHIYYLEVGDANQKGQVAYLTVGDGTAEPAYQNVAANEANAVTVVDLASASVTAEQLQRYEVVVVSNLVPADGAAASALKEALPFVPTLCLNADLYAAWGYGVKTPGLIGMVRIANLKHELFRGFVLNEDYVKAQPDGVTEVDVLDLGEGFTGVTLGDYFATDDVVATDAYVSETTAIHVHNANHNAYVYLPAEAAGNSRLVANAVSLLMGSKSDVTKTPAPTVAFTYNDRNTDVTLSVVPSNLPKTRIYYTLDGSEPTEQSTEYTEPFNVAAEGVTVKAVGIAEGYLLSDVTEQAVKIKSQLPAPTISVATEAGKSVVTVSGEGTIWYNYSGRNDSVWSTQYTGPVTLTYPRTFYAFVTGEDKVNSEVASQQVGVEGYQPRIDVLAHMDANAAEYNGGSTSTAYYFSWGKNKSGASGHPYYNTTEGVTEETYNDEETGDEGVRTVYTILNEEEEKDFGNGWVVRSRGQLVDWENLTTGSSFGDKTGYNYATVDDENPYFPATRSIINLADKNTEPTDASFPYNAYIVTTAKYAGPFDVVVNVGSIVKPENSATHLVVVQTSVDGNAWDSNWVTLGDTIAIKDRQRLTTNVTRSYEGTEEVYVRVYLADKNSKVGFYDVYIANAGEESQKLLTGIADLQQPAAKAPAAIYSLNGTRQQQLRRGLNIVVGADGTVKKVLVK